MFAGEDVRLAISAIRPFSLKAFQKLLIFAIGRRSGFSFARTRTHIIAAGAD